MTFFENSKTLVFITNPKKHKVEFHLQLKSCFQEMKSFSRRSRYYRTEQKTTSTLQNVTMKLKQKKEANKKNKKIEEKEKLTSNFKNPCETMCHTFKIA